MALPANGILALLRVLDLVGVGGYLAALITGMG